MMSNLRTRYYDLSEWSIPNAILDGYEEFSDTLYVSNI